MLLQESPATAPAQADAQSEQARNLAGTLREEFGVPFRFHELAGGAGVWRDADYSPTTSTADSLAAAAEGRAVVIVLDDGRYQLTLPLFAAGRPVLAAIGEIVGLSLTAGHDANREQSRLQKWVAAVADRLRLADLARGRRRDEDATPWETLLTLDTLVRRMRVHKEPAKNQQRILEAAHKMLRVEALIWVPSRPDGTVVVQGESLLTPADCRTLAGLLAQGPDFRPFEPLLWNDFATGRLGSRFPQVRTLLAFTVTDQGPIGWVIALNKSSGGNRQPAGGAVPTPFRRSDAALLTPFVALLELHARASARYQDLKELLVGLTRSLTAALDAKDSYTYGHSERVARIAVELGRELGLQGDELSDIYLAGLLHDVGKIGIRDAILGKVEPLTVEEFEHIKQHVLIGYAILSDLRPIRSLLPGVLYHHERWDGKGYPDGLQGEAIPLLARILAVADSYDAMSTNRPYRDAMPCRKVEEILVSGAGVQWDKRVIDAFLKCRQRIHTIRQRGVGDSLQMAIDGALHIEKSSLTRNDQTFATRL